MIERTQTGSITLTEQGQKHIDEFAQHYGKNAAEWNMSAIYNEVEESLNNCYIGETLAHELRSFDSAGGNPVIFSPVDGDIEYQPIDE